MDVVNFQIRLVLTNRSCQHAPPIFQIHWERGKPVALSGSQEASFLIRGEIREPSAFQDLTKLSNLLCEMLNIVVVAQKTLFQL
ncbi:hypothetical protein AJ87_21540 [Rhizobium yanglingense]|nr:hypothetical protein AJ87_21540 [Rhizobium yanglingense]